jgi:molybdate transport system substrate-binding protein
MAMDAIRAAGLEQQFAGRLVITPDMPQILMYAEIGTVDAAFVRLTEALTAKKAKILFTVPSRALQQNSLHDGATPNGFANADARSFFSFLKSADAKSILKKHGYLMK